MTNLWLEAYFFELPFDTGLPDRFIVHIKDDGITSYEPGWEDFDLGAFLRLDPAPGPGLRSTTLEFRQGSVRLQSGIVGSIATAYPEVLVNSQMETPRWRRALLRTGLYRYRLWRSAPTEPKTIVQATRIAYPPPANEDDGHWRGDQITKALHELNDYLRALAGVSDHPAVGPVAAPQLPPLLWGYRLRLPQWFSNMSGQWEHFALVLHDIVPWTSSTLTRSDADLALCIATSQGLPFMRPTQWLDLARRSFGLESCQPAVIEAGTAMELLVSDAVRHCAPLAGYAQTKVNNVLDGDFASKVKDHLAPLLAYQTDPAVAQDALGEWWRHGYDLRNEVVHRGHRPSAEETRRALETADELLGDVITRVQADSRFSSIFGTGHPLGQ